MPYFIGGTPYGFSEPTAPWPGTTPNYFVWDVNGYFPPGTYAPQRYTVDMPTIPAARILPNGTKIDKFQGYAAPKIYPREVWQWIARGSNTLGDDASLEIFIGQRVGIYIISHINTSSGSIYTARGRIEKMVSDRDPQFNNNFVTYTAEIERLTDYQFASTVSFV